MSTPLLIITSAIYFWVAVDLGLEGKGGLAVTFAFYSLANIGLIAATKGY